MGLPDLPNPKGHSGGGRSGASAGVFAARRPVALRLASADSTEIPQLDAVPEVFEFVDVLPDDHNSFPARACNRHLARPVENSQHELGQPPRHRLGVGRVAE